MTGLYVVFTPLIAWLFTRRRFATRVIVGVVLAMVGLAIFSGAAANIEFQIGQIWLVVCAVLYAIHILLLGKYGMGRTPYRMAMIQIAFAAIVCWGFAPRSGPRTRSQWKVVP